jgi:hypothetical protein
VLVVERAGEAPIGLEAALEEVVEALEHACRERPVRLTISLIESPSANPIALISAHSRTPTTLSLLTWIA